MLIFFTPHFAQAQPFPGTGGEGDALNIVTSSLELARNTVQSWESVWQIVIDPLGSSLWIALIKLGMILAAASILFLTMTSGKDAIEKQSWSELVSMFVWPLVILFFLSANGHLLADTVRFVRGFSYAQVQRVIDLQVGEMTFRDAITRTSITSVARQQIENLYSECRSKVGEELVQCWDSKKDVAQQIIEEAERQAGGSLTALRNAAQFIWDQTGVGVAVKLATDPGSLLRDNFVPIVKLLLWGLQWAFVNVLEVALLLTALFSPIAMGMSLLPLQGRPIWAWLIGFLSLFGVQLGYNIVVGLTAIVLVKSGAEYVSDVAFLLFLSFFAPALAVLIAGGGGLALYNGINSNVKQVTDILSNAIGAATNIALKKAKF